MIIDGGPSPGGIPWRDFIGPTALEFRHTDDDPSRSFSYGWTFVQFNLNVGLLKARKGISPGRGVIKMGVGEIIFSVDTSTAHPRPELGSKANPDF